MKHRLILTIAHSSLFHFILQSAEAIIALYKKSADSWLSAFTFTWFSLPGISPVCLLEKFQVISIKIPFRCLFLKKVFFKPDSYQ